jgi:hypothetical protein
MTRLFLGLVLLKLLLFVNYFVKQFHFSFAGSPDYSPWIKLFYWFLGKQPRHVMTERKLPLSLYFEPKIMWLWE